MWTGHVEMQASLTYSAQLSRVESLSLPFITSLWVALLGFLWASLTWLCCHAEGILPSLTAVCVGVYDGINQASIRIWFHVAISAEIMWPCPGGPD